MDTHNLDQHQSPTGMSAPAPGMAGSSRLHRGIGIAVRLLGSILLVIWLIATVDWQHTFRALFSVPWYGIMGALLLYVTSQFITAFRLKLLLRAQSVFIDYWYSVRLTFLGLFANNFLPGSIGGDGVKIAALARAYGTTLAFVAVAADRVANFVMVALLLPTVFLLPAFLPAFTTQTLALSMTGYVFGVLLVIALVRALKNYGRAQSPHRPASLAHRFHVVVRSVFAILDIWNMRPLTLLSALILSLLSVLCVVSSTWLASICLSVPATFGQIMAVVVINYFAALVPVSFNGLGVQEFGFTYLLVLLGTMPDQALAVALLTRFSYVGASLIGAFEVARLSDAKEGKSTRRNGWI